MPQVSIIVPNYNHAPYLRERLDSILAQTYQDFELLLLDDCSTDNSREILEEYAAKDPRIRLLFNDKNSGSPFAQWNRGAEQAGGDFLWIAESDDSAEPDLLEENVKRLLAHPQVGIAFCQSHLVDEEGRFIRSYNDDYDFLFQTNRWEQDFVASGREECANYLVRHNTIPNASAALIRKTSFFSAGGADPSWRLNGDWMFYVRLLLISDLAFCARPLNRFRVHRHTQRQRANATHHAYDEILAIQDFVVRQVEVPEATRRCAFGDVARWWSGSLFRQQVNAAYWKENWRLYKIFRKRKPRLAGTILYITFYLATKQLIGLLGLKYWLKPILVRWFPGRFFKG